MPRATRRLPVGLTRFNYWTYEVCQPRQAAELGRHLRLHAGLVAGGRHDPVQADLRERFRRHCEGPCGEPFCAADHALAHATPRRRAELALRDYIENSREWARDPDAQRVFRELPAEARRRLLERANQLYGRTGKRRWQTLLGAIARDQRLFEEMLPDGPAKVLNADPDAYPSARKVWTEYAREALAVLGKVPAGLNEFWLPTGGRERARLDLKGMTSEQREQTPHWFAHAFRNLLRYRDGHPPLPFSPACAKVCRAVLNGFPA